MQVMTQLLIDFDKIFDESLKKMALGILRKFVDDDKKDPEHDVKFVALMEKLLNRMDIKFASSDSPTIPSRVKLILHREPQIVVKWSKVACTLDGQFTQIHQVRQFLLRAQVSYLQWSAHQVCHQ